MRIRRANEHFKVRACRKYDSFRSIDSSLSASHMPHCSLSHFTTHPIHSCLDLHHPTHICTMRLTVSVAVALLGLLCFAAAEVSRF